MESRLEDEGRALLHPAQAASAVAWKRIMEKNKENKEENKDTQNRSDRDQR